VVRSNIPNQKNLLAFTHWTKPLLVKLALHTDFVIAVSLRQTPTRPISMSTVNTSSPHLYDRQPNAMPLNQRPSLLRIASVHTWRRLRASYDRKKIESNGTSTRQHVKWFVPIYLTKAICLYSLTEQSPFESNLRYILISSLQCHYARLQQGQFRCLPSTRQVPIYTIDSQMLCPWIKDLPCWE